MAKKKRYSSYKNPPKLKKKRYSYVVNPAKSTKVTVKKEFDGLFGHVVTIKSGNVTIKNSDLDFTFTIPFDDDPEANEAEIEIYNLSATTIAQLKKGECASTIAKKYKSIGCTLSFIMKNNNNTKVLSKKGDWRTMKIGAKVLVGYK